jgi:hypothetical protein
MNGAEYNDLEKRQAKKDGAVLVKNSGRGERKGDARRGTLLVDYKYTGHQSFAINVKAWDKHAKDAWTEGYEPCIVPIFQSHGGKCLAIVDWDWLKNELDELEELRWMREGLEK